MIVWRLSPSIALPFYRSVILFSDQSVLFAVMQGPFNDNESCFILFYLLAKFNILLIYNGTDNFVADSSGSYSHSVHGFLFSFKNKDGLEPFKLHIKNYEHAIYGSSGYGPTFGGGHDIYIADGAGSNTNSYSNLGHNYVQVAGYKYGASDTASLLAGSNNFQPHEVEVFYQTYQS